MEGSSSEMVDYVVQRPLGDAQWQDIPVRLPKRSQTRTVLLAGLREAGIAPAEAMRGGLRFRVLSAEAAHEHGLKAKEPREPEIELA